MFMAADLETFLPHNGFKNEQTKDPIGYHWHLRLSREAETWNLIGWIRRLDDQSLICKGA